MGPRNRARGPIRHRMIGPAAAALSLLVLAGCAAGAMSPPEKPAALPPASAAPSAGAARGGSPSDISVAVAGGPSASAMMVCGEETRANVVRILALPSAPGTAASWADKLFTCTYALPGGPLVLSVKEAADPAAAHAAFGELQRTTGSAAPIEGMANLGLPAFQTPGGAVVFVKDSFVLRVDATALPAAVGPHQVSRSAFAYQVATTVLACWSE